MRHILFLPFFSQKNLAIFDRPLAHRRILVKVFQVLISSKLGKTADYKGGGVFLILVSRLLWSINPFPPPRENQL